MPVYKNKSTNNKPWYFRKRIIIDGKSKEFKRRGFLTRREAQIAMERFGVINNDVSDSCKNIIFKKLYDEYIDFYSRQRKPNSLRKQKNIYLKHILPYFAEKKVLDINEKSYQEWKKKIIEKGYSDKYNKNIHGAAVTIFEYAIFHDYAKINIAKKSKGFPSNNIVKPNRVWSFDEYKIFIDVVNNIVDRALFKLLYLTGVRYGEAAALRWSDFDGECISVYKSLSKELDKNGNRIETRPKTKSSERTIRLSDDLIKELNELRDYYKIHNFFNLDCYIFGCEVPYSHTKATRRKDYYCSLAGVSKIRLHDFRHSHASLLIDQNIPITEIADRLGHANSKVTMDTYAHVINRKDSKAVEALNRLTKESF